MADSIAGDNVHRDKAGGNVINIDNIEAETFRLLVQMRGEVSATHETMEQIKRELFGNGHAGVFARMANLEDMVMTNAKAISIIKNTLWGVAAIMVIMATFMIMVSQ